MIVHAETYQSSLDLSPPPPNSPPLSKKNFTIKLKDPLPLNQSNSKLQEKTAIKLVNGTHLHNPKGPGEFSFSSMLAVFS